MIAPVTKEAIQAAFEARGLSPLHRFGQNFLIRPDVLDRIVAAAELRPDEVVLEVGPGTGGLTERLLAACRRVVAAEIDRGLADHLRDLFADDSRFELIVGDVMMKKSALEPDVVQAVMNAGGADGPWCVVANLPYQISSPFLSALGSGPAPPRRIVATLQKEVGIVLNAGPGDEDYTPLSFLARLVWDVERLMVLSPSSFWPAPKVDSVVMRLDTRPERPTSLAATIALGRRLFQGRRKALRSTVARATGVSAEQATAWLEAAGLSPTDRIDGVDPEAIARVAALAHPVEDRW